MEQANLSIQQPPSSLFTVRIWREALGEEPRKVRMEVRHVLSGETRHFRDWAHLAAYLEDKLPTVPRPEGAKGGAAE